MSFLHSAFLGADGVLEFGSGAARDDHPEERLDRVPSRQQIQRQGALRRHEMPLEERADIIDVAGTLQPIQLDEFQIHATLEGSLSVKDVRAATGHAGPEVPPGRTQDEHEAARHVLAAMIA